MLKLIAEDFGEDLANAVADQLIYEAEPTKTPKDYQYQRGLASATQN